MYQNCNLSLNIIILSRLHFLSPSYLSQIPIFEHFSVFLRLKSIQTDKKKGNQIDWFLVENLVIYFGFILYSLKKFHLFDTFILLDSFIFSFFVFPKSYFLKLTKTISKRLIFSGNLVRFNLGFCYFKVYTLPTEKVSSFIIFFEKFKWFLENLNWCSNGCWRIIWSQI